MGKKENKKLNIKHKIGEKALQREKNYLTWFNILSLQTYFLFLLVSSDIVGKRTMIKSRDELGDLSFMIFLE